MTTRLYYQIDPVVDDSVTLKDEYMATLGEQQKVDVANQYNKLYNKTEEANAQLEQEYRKTLWHMSIYEIGQMMSEQTTQMWNEFSLLSIKSNLTPKQYWIEFTGILLADPKRSIVAGLWLILFAVAFGLLFTTDF
jgi:hypothetical protein